MYLRRIYYTGGPRQIIVFSRNGPRFAALSGDVEGGKAVVDRLLASMQEACEAVLHEPEVLKQSFLGSVR